MTIYVMKQNKIKKSFFFSFFGGLFKNNIWEGIYIFEMLVNSGLFHQLQF